MTGFSRSVQVTALAFSLLLSDALLAAQEREEIIVTSRKVEENIQDVPVAITSFNVTDIREARIENLDDIAGLTPGLNFFNPTGESLPVPVIRGIAPTDIFGEPNAAVYINGVYAAGREGLNFALLDIERIEINKGPQSALYGRNAFSGAINYVTKRPSNEFSSRLELTGGNDERVAAKAIFSGPLIADKLAASVGLGYDTWGGSYSNPIGSEGIGGYTYKTITTGLEWTPNDSFDALLNVYFSEDSIDDAALTGQVANCEDTGGSTFQSRRLSNYCGELWNLERINAQLNNNIPGNPNIPDGLEFTSGDKTIARIPGAKGEEREVTRASLNLDWDTDIGMFTSLTGYSKVLQSSVLDGTRNLGFTFPFVYCNDVSGYANFPGMITNDLPACRDFRTPKRFTTGEYVISPEAETTEINQELLFRSPVDKAVRYSVGAYYFDFENIEPEPYVLASAPNLPNGLEAAVGPGTNPPAAAFGPWPGFGIAIGDAAFRPWFTPTSTAGLEETITTNTDSYSFFGSLDWDLTDRLTADFQLRYTKDNRDYTVVAPALMSTRKASKESSYVTGRAGLRFNINDDTIVYGAVSNGVKPGGFDADVVDVLVMGGPAESRIVIVPFEEEKLTSYELGAKGSTRDGFFRYDAALYYQDWTDIVIPQVFNNDPISGDPLEQPEGFNTNAGDATVKGAEVQGDFAFTDRWFAGFGASYTDAELDKARLESFADFPSFMPDGDVSGNKLLRQPEWQANANLRYIQPLAGDWELNTRADVIYQDEYFGGLDNQWTIPSHTYVNLRLAFETETLSISFWGKNLFNDTSPIAAYRDVYFGNTDDIFQKNPASSTPQKFFPWRIVTTHPRLRTFGMTVAVRFGAG